MTTKVADSVATQYAARTSKNAGTLTKLQSKTMVRSLKYKNPLNKGQKANSSPSPPPSDATTSKNNVKVELDDVDTLDFNSFVVDLNDDLTAVRVDPSIDVNAFGNYDIDLADADLADMKDIESVFDSHEVDLDKIKKVSPKSNGAPLAVAAAPVATGAPMAPVAAAPAGAPMAPMPTERVSNTKKQFAAGAVPLLSEAPQMNESIRPEAYDKAADIRYNPDGSIMDKTNQTQQLQEAAKVSQFSGLQSNRNIVSKKESDEALTKHAKGKVTHFTGLEQSTRKIVTADEEEQKRIADSRLVHKQKSMFNKKHMEQRQSMKRTSIKVDDSVKDAAQAAKNVFKAMEKQNTKKTITKRPTAKRLKSRAKTKTNVAQK